MFQVRFLRRIAMRGGVALAALIAVGLGFAIFAYPAAAAAACPTCYGFEKLEPDVFVDRAMPAAQRAETLAVIDGARAKVRDFYGTLTSSPRILICATKSCYDHIGGGGSRGMAMLDFALKVSAEAHEVTDVDFSDLAGHGFTNDDIWDIAAIAAFFGLSNRMANVTNMRPNDEFYLMGRLPK